MLQHAWYLWHLCESNVCPDPVWKPVSRGQPRGEFADVRAHNIMSWNVHSSLSEMVLNRHTRRHIAHRSWWLWAAAAAAAPRTVTGCTTWAEKSGHLLLLLLLRLITINQRYYYHYYHYHYYYFRTEHGLCQAVRTSCRPLRHHLVIPGHIDF